MKKMINYFYKLYPTKIYNLNDEIYFFDNEYKYYIKKYADKKKIDSYIMLHKHFKEINVSLNEILLNKDNSYITEYEKKTYIVIRVCEVEDVEINISDIMKYNINAAKEIYTVIEVDELDSMKKEIDNYEILVSGYSKEHFLVQNVFNYYVGLAENAVSYMSDSIKETKVHEKSINHYKINKNLSNKNLIDITNISYNYKLKDISEYFRILFIYDLEWEEILSSFFGKYILNEFDYRFLYSELLYPRYFFDAIDDMINNHTDSKELEYLAKNVNEMENKLNKLFIIINRYCQIPPIWWINEKSN